MGGPAWRQQLRRTEHAAAQVAVQVPDLVQQEPAAAAWMQQPQRARPSPRGCQSLRGYWACSWVDDLGVRPGPRRSPAAMLGLHASC